LRGERSVTFRALGCVFGGLLFCLPFVIIVGGALWFMQASHSIAPVADAMGFVHGPDYGFDGWYVGERSGYTVALAATYRRDGPKVIRRQAREYVEASCGSATMPPRSSSATGVRGACTAGAPASSMQMTWKSVWMP
jgi:hypothetical protein